MIYLYTFICAFIISFIFSPLMKRIALFYDILDHPDSPVKTHEKPTPYLGGIAIWLGFTLSLLAVRFFTNFETGTLRNLRGIFVAGLIILLIGLYDDLMDLHFKKKFGWQLVAATVLIIFDMKIKFVQPSYLGIIFTYFWIIAIVNAFNLIDIMDGLSCGVAVIAALAFFFINAPGESLYVNFAAIALAGACLGFLPFNWPKAKMFMGDTGSMFIGLVLASLSLGSNYTVNNNISVFTPIVVLGIAIYDTLYIIHKRIEQNKPIFLGSKDHFALRLGKMGWSTKKILFVTYTIALLCGVLSYLITRADVEYAVILYISVLAAGILIAAFLGRVNMDE
ncbi:glycosyltransferase family 4 protein [bacterium]